MAKFDCIKPNRHRQSAGIGIESASPASRTSLLSRVRMALSISCAMTPWSTRTRMAHGPDPWKLVKAIQELKADNDSLAEKHAAN